MVLALILQPVTGQIVSNGGFETPVLPLESFQYNPIVPNWTLSDGVAIANNESPFTFESDDAPEGVQVLVLQDLGRTATQTVALPANGLYRVRLKAAQRSDNHQAFEVYLGGQYMDTFTPADGEYREYVSRAVSFTAGSHDLQLTSILPLAGDHSALIDDVRIENIDTQTRNWSDPATWGGSVPAAGADVTIPADKVVILDQDISVGRVTVNGTLRFARQNLTVQAISLLAMGESARIEIGTEKDPFLQDLTLTLEGGNDASTMMGGNVIGSMMGGTLSIHGEDRTSWTQLAMTAPAGATTISLEDAVDWRVGDQILITTTRRDWEEAELKTIQTIAADGRSLAFNTPLTYPHHGETQSYTRTEDGRTWTADYRASVGLITRNITLQGNAASASSGYGGHMMIMASNTMRAGRAMIEGVEFYRMGQKSRLGRYPIHTHLLGNQGKGVYFRNNSIYRSFNRAVTLHSTDSTLVENNFAFDVLGHALFLEDGAERDNRIIRNVIGGTRRPVPGEEVTPSDNQNTIIQNFPPAAYWLTNPDNIVTDNIAAGGDGTGFWLIFPKDVMGVSLSDPRFSSIKPSQAPLGALDRNVAHSFETGIDVGDTLDANHSIIRNKGWDHPGPHTLYGNQAYANTLGIYAGLADESPIDNVIHSGYVVAENERGIMNANSYLTEDTAFVAKTGLGLNNVTNHTLFTIYDGPMRFKDIHIVGYDQENTSFLFNSGASFKHANHTTEGVTYDHPGFPRSTLSDFGFNGGYGINPRIWGLTVYDIDGTLAGKPQSTIVCNHPFVLTGNEIQHPNWVNTYRSDHRFALQTFGHNDYDANFVDVTVTRAKPGTPSAYVFYERRFDVEMQLPLIVDEGFVYSYNFHSLPSNPSFRLGLADVEAGKSIVTRFPGFGNLNGLSLLGNSPIQVVSSLEELNSASTSARYIDSNNDLWVRVIMEPQLRREKTYFDISWSSGSIDRTFDSDGDGVDDLVEVDLGRNPVETDLTLTFDFPNALSGWTQSGLSSLTNTDNQLVAVASTSSPQVIREGLQIDQNAIDTFYVRYRTDQVGDLKLLWANESGTFSSHCTALPTTISFPNSDYILARYDLAGNPEWLSSGVSALRFDLPGGTGGQTEIDWILDSSSDTDRDGVSAEDELSVFLDPLSASDLGIEFTAENPLLMIEPDSVADFSYDNGIVRGTATSNDPKVEINGFNFLGEDVDKIVMKFRSTASGQVQIFWKAGEAIFSGARVINESYTSPGAWQYLEFDTDSLGDDWNGNESRITALRIDPGSTNGSEWEIDWIRATDGDRDNDGLSDADEDAYKINSDKDGFANFSDYDSDNDGVSDYDEVLVGSDPSVSGLNLTFDTGTSLGEWVTSGLSLAQVVGGKLLAESSGSAPYLIRSGLTLDPSGIRDIYVRYHATSNEDLTLYWANANGSAPSLQRMALPVVVGDFPSGYKIAHFDLSVNLGWNESFISELRLGLLSGTGVETEIDWMLVGTSDPDGDLICVTDELAAGRDPVDASDLAFEFKVDSPRVEWSQSNLSSFSLYTGSATGTPSSGDPMFANCGLSFPGADVSEILIKFRSSANNSFTIFWGNDLADVFAASRRITANYSGSGDWQYLVFDMSSESGSWTDRTITRLRFDPNTTANADWEIAWIRAMDGDFDNDGILDVNEGPVDRDTDGDGREDFADNDADGDGVSDAIEQTLGRNPFANVEHTLDADGDGDSDLFEMIVGTDPDAAGSYFDYTLAVITQGTGQRVFIDFMGQSGRSYLLFHSDDLSDNSWTEIQRRSVNSELPVSFDTFSETPEAFFRIQPMINSF